MQNLPEICCLPECPSIFLLAVLGDQLLWFDWDWGISQDSGLFVLKLGQSQANCWITFWAKSWLRYQVSLQPGGQCTNQHPHIWEKATLLHSSQHMAGSPQPPHSSAYQGPFQIDFHLFQSFHSKFWLWLLTFPRVAWGMMHPPYFLYFFYIYCSSTLHQASG